MLRSFQSFFFAFLRKRHTIFLAFSFFGGLLLGIFFFNRTRTVSSLLMHSSLFSAVSIVDLLSGVLLPFILSSIVVVFHLSWLIYPFSFAKAFVFSYVSLLIAFSFQPAGMVIRSFLLFHEFLSLPILYYYWTTHLLNNRSDVSVKTFAFLAVGAVIGFIEFFISSRWIIL